MFHLVLPTETLPENGKQIQVGKQPFYPTFFDVATLVEQNLQHALAYTAMQKYV
ncbi:hypothetical protein [Martelella limonii]|uniref:hypothetical protein n=1 Tax=Martelella limonii TaxID=1647649 RepID=UPI0015811A3B|nr:hypothetical protein [Martelella limonii]